MNDKQADQDTFRSFQLMNEIENGSAVSQRELASRLGVAVGLVNSYLKNFVAKGFVRVKNYPRNRYAYLLTPKGLAEKSRLAYRHLSYFNSLYTVVRQDYLNLFRGLRNNGYTHVVFCGVDDVTEIVYLSLMEEGLKLSAVIDEVGVGESFLGFEVHHVDEYSPAESGTEALVFTSLKRMEALESKIEQLGHDGAYSPKNNPYV